MGQLQGVVHALAVMLVAATGCPGAAPSASRAPVEPQRARRAIERPPLGALPFPVLVRAASSSPEAAELRRIVADVLSRSAVFALAEEGLEKLATVVQLDAHRRRRTLRIEARLHELRREPWSTLTLEGAQMRRLALRLADAIQREFIDEPSPALSRITFVSATGAGEGSKQVFVIGYDGQGVQRISYDGALNILPALSSRGDIAFTTFARGHPELVLLPAGGARATTLPSHGELNMGAAFSPEGTTIALTVSREGNTDIYLLRRSGELLRRVTRDPAIDISPTWSPDGSRLVFVSDRSGTPQLYVTPVTAETPRRLTHTGSYNQEPNWCSRPGSGRVAYTRRHADERYELYVVDVETAESVQLTRDGRTNKSPRWSPNCRQLVYSSDDGLWIMGADGARRFRLFRGRAETPAWSAVQL